MTHNANLCEGRKRKKGREKNRSTEIERQKERGGESEGKREKKIKDREVACYRL